MTKWLEEIIRQAKSVDAETFKPMEEVDSKDHVLGEVDEQSKKFYALAKTYERFAISERKQASGLFIDASSKQRLQEDARKTDQKANAIWAIFYASVKDANKLWGDHINIKKGWKIVRKMY